MIGYHAPALAHPDSAALEVLSGIMNRRRPRRRRHGALYKALVDNKEAVSVSMDQRAARSWLFVLAAATLTKVNRSGSAQDHDRHDLANVVAEPPTKEEVERAKPASCRAWKRT